MSPKVDAFVDRHGWQILVFLVSATVAWTTLKAQVQGKADKADMDALRSQVRQESAQIQSDIGAVKRMLCRDPRNAQDSACP